MSRKRKTAQTQERPPWYVIAIAMFFVLYLIQG